MFESGYLYEEISYARVSVTDRVRGRAAALADDRDCPVRRYAGRPHPQEGHPEHHQRPQDLQLRWVWHGGRLLHRGGVRQDRLQCHACSHLRRRFQRLRNLG